ncbi:MAG: hypothetical protein ACFE7R_10405 [Candidatus Hodarchaeota archaeon]
MKRLKNSILNDMLCGARMQETKTHAVFLLMLLILTFVTPTEAVINHGLYWGLEIGDRIDYHYRLRRTDSSLNYDLDYYVVVDDLPSISENITEIPRIVGTSASESNYYNSFYFMNDTEILPQTLVPTLPWHAYPMGNWSLVEEAVISNINTSTWEITIIDTEREWGIILNGEDPRWIREESGVFSKDDGALLRFEWDWHDNSGGFLRTSWVRIQDVLVPWEIAVVISVGLIALVLVVIVRRRN